MKTIELRPREFHRRIGWALAEARRGVAIVITAPGQPAVTLSVGRPKAGNAKTSTSVDWDAHFEWLKNQPILPVNPVDELRSTEQR